MSHPSFVLQKSQIIPELECRANLFFHTKTGAQLLSIVNSDENKAFAITFPTPPTDSTGVAHIMEHSVLCGSRAYPVKEPFVQLLKGSLHTFLNAFTYPDKTSYPVASTNEKDFYNLTRVYLDSVFFPKITAETLMQEGWHVHQETDKDTPILQGVVFNEMKGAYNSPDRALYDAICQSIFPNTTYAHDSGGNPLSIPDLSYDQFVQFHKKYYHPSNSLLFFYGDDDESSRLQLAGEYLDQFPKQQIDASINLDSAIHTPTVFSQSYTASDTSTDQKAMITQNWLLPSVADHALVLSLRMLDFLLIGTSGSRLKKALIDLGIGDDIAGSGLETELSRMVYSIGLKGTQETQSKKIVGCIRKTLEKIVRDGFSKEEIKGVLNVMEFSLRENNTGSFPRGLSLVYSILPSWQSGADPIEALKFADRMQDIHARLDRGERVFESLVQKYFLDNQAYSIVVLSPDKKLKAVLEKKEMKLLEKKRSAQDVTNTQRLLTVQKTTDTPEDIAKIPKLAIHDVLSAPPALAREVFSKKDYTLVAHTLDTNGIIYMDLLFDFSHLDQSELSLLPMYERSLLEMGTKNEPYDVFLHRQTRDVGGIWTSLSTGKKWGQQDHLYSLVLRAKFLPSQLASCGKIFEMIASELDFSNKERFLTMLLQEKNDYQESLLESGNGFVHSRIASAFDSADRVDEICSGVEQFQTILALIERVKNDWESVRASLCNIHTKMMCKATRVVHITTSKNLLSDAQKMAEQTLARFPAVRAAKKQEWTFTSVPSVSTLIVPTSVQYVGIGGNVARHGYVFDGSSLVISRYLRTSFLWEQIRMKGGAYGAFVSFDSSTLTCCFISYRDPRLEETLQDFAKIPEFLQTISLDSSALHQAIIGAIGDFDHYQLPDAKGYSDLHRYRAGITAKQRLMIREQILSTTLTDFHEFGAVLQKMMRDTVTCVVSPKARAVEGEVVQVLY